MCQSTSFAQQISQHSDQYQKGVEAFSQGDYYSAANIWLVEAYEGSHEAQFNLGVMYLEGKGVPQDREEGIFWFTRAAQAGHIEAQYNLGHLYFENQENPELLEIGVGWWKQAAQQGFAIAQYNYGRALYYGLGENKDLKASKYWMELSAQSGVALAIQFIEANAETFQGIPSSSIASQESFNEDTLEVADSSQVSTDNIADPDQNPDPISYKLNPENPPSDSEFTAQSGQLHQTEPYQNNTENNTQDNIQSDIDGIGDVAENQFTVDQFVAQLRSQSDDQLLGQSEEYFVRRGSITDN